MQFGKLGRGFGHLGQHLGSAQQPPAPPNTLVASRGSFVLTGDAMNPLVDRKLPSALGTFTLTGQDATLTSSAPAGIAIDAVGSVVHFDSSSSFTVSITTVAANAVIILACNTNAGALAGAPTASGLTFALGSNGTELNMVYYWALAATPGTYTITVAPNSAAYSTAVAFSFKNAASAVFDGSIVTGTTDPLAYTPTNANDAVFAIYSVNTDNPTAGSGWTQVCGQNFCLVEYKIVSSTSPVSATITTGAGQALHGIVHALKQG